MGGSDVSFDPGDVDFLSAIPWGHGNKINPRGYQDNPWCRRIKILKNPHLTGINGGIWFKKQKIENEVLLFSGKNIPDHFIERFNQCLFSLEVIVERTVEHE
jgi:hypothetical protein